MNYGEVLYWRIQEVRPSDIWRFFNILEEMKDAVSLGMREPDFVTPWHIRDTGIHSLEEGFTKCTSNTGITELRQRIAAYLNRRFGLQYDFAHQIVATVDGSEAIDLALRHILNPGDEVIISVLSFMCYGPLTSMAGGTPVYVELRTESEFRFTATQLRVALAPCTKAVVFPFPSDPIGDIPERADLEALAEVLKNTNAMVLSDEIYAELTYGQKHVSPANLPELYGRTIMVSGFSRSHAVAGWRTGYICNPAPILQQMLRLHQFGIMSAPTTSQYTVIETMHNDDVDIEKMRGEYSGRHRYLMEGLRRIGLPYFEPKSVFYVFPDIRGTGLTSDEFCERFLMEEKVTAISGSAFGPSGESFIRCCYTAGMKDIAEALVRMDNFLTDLRKEQVQKGWASIRPHS